VYVANTALNSISSFTIDQATGALAPLETVPGGSGPTGLVLTPDNRFLVVANSDAPAGGTWGGAGTVSVFARNTATGALSEIAGSPFPAHAMALNVAISPDGRFVYATNQFDYQVTTFALDPATGALTEASFSPLAETEAHSIAMHPTGTFLYTGSEESDVKGHVLNAADGSYTDTPGTPYPSAGANNWLTITPSGRHLFTSDGCCSTPAGSGALRTFAIDTSTGALSEIAGSPLIVPAPNTGNEAMRTSAVKPSGDFLYVGRWFGSSVGAYRIDRATGALTEVTGSPFAAGTQPKSIAVEGQGRFLYALNFGSNSVSAFRIDASTGALTPIDTYPTVANARPKMILTAP
jgi:6-phosphogluconolactonase (cycloisomerase 2 family)